MANLGEYFELTIGEARSHVMFRFHMEEGSLKITVKENGNYATTTISPGDFLELVSRIAKLAKYAEDRQMESIL